MMVLVYMLKKAAKEKVCTIESGHHPYTENPVEFKRAVEEFVE
ncbi:hypothetical protein [Lentibacillus sp. Marseille-P4043]|nr:hypothetical protein [Lentibacillus sp. Marseille-P4043]